MGAPHPTVQKSPWTPETVARFWSHVGSMPRYRDVYFGKLVGLGVANFLQLTGRLRGDVLDYGCGPGHLLRHLLTMGVRCFGSEYTQVAVDAIQYEFEGHPKWGGAALLDGMKAPFPAASFDVITCTETVEHLREVDLPHVLRLLHDMLKPGGMLLITTPHNENLEGSMVYCPFCSTEFHQMQHVQSFTEESLREHLLQARFEVPFCAAIDLREFMPPANAAYQPSRWRGLGRSIKRWARRRGQGRQEIPTWSLFRRTQRNDHMVALATRRVSQPGKDA